ncbi:MAG: cobyric acid synthase [Nitrospinae bacterium]|nr:cobyric acid synthase [Nitrospinota bacterium]
MNRDKYPAKTVAVLGTGSDVGKSIVTAALCRIFREGGQSVAPFKAQNMSNNSFVTKDGGEMGRAQVVQAEAAGIEPHVDMNPVLLKPSSDTGAQVVLQGEVVGNSEAAHYFKNTDYLFGKARESLNRLRSKYDLVIMEGAGSCAEMNIRDRDFVNFRMAKVAEAPVILVADIDRGGVFAQIIGTLNIIPEEDRRMVKGIIINRFRGDAALFDDGIKYIEKKTGIPVLGLIPYFRHIEIDSEDGLPLDIIIDPSTPLDSEKINIAVLRLPHISNFTDFAPLSRDPGVTLHYLSRGRDIKGYDLLIIPGTKNARFDMAWMRDVGWERYIADYSESGGHICGICGGYQMLGNIIRDPQGIEGSQGETVCLKFLDIETTLEPDKILSRSKGTFMESGIEVEGYEIHHGLTKRGEWVKPLIRLDSRSGNNSTEDDGAINEDGRVWGTYLHGLFDNNEFRKVFLKGLSPKYSGSDSADSQIAFKDRQYGLLAEHFREYLNMERLNEIIGINQNRRS